MPTAEHGERADRSARPASAPGPCRRVPARRPGSVRNPNRSPSQPPSGAMRPPTSAAVPMTRPIAEARPVSRPRHALDHDWQVGPAHLVGEERDAEDQEDPSDGRIAQDARGSAPKASVSTRPSGTTAGRTSREPNVTSSAVPTESAADSQNTIGSDQPKPSMRTPARAGPDAIPTAVDDPKMPITVPESSSRRDLADAGEHHAGVAELEADQEHAQRELPRFARQGDPGEDDRLDQRAPDDDRLPAVLVGPDAPQRHERHPYDEDQRSEEADEGEPLVLGHAHLAQVARDEREDLADAETFDHRGKPEDREQDVASPGRVPGRRVGRAPAGDRWASWSPGAA